MQQLAHPFTSALIGSVGLMTTCSCEGDREQVERIAKQVMDVSMREGYPVTLAWSKACIGWVQAPQGKRDGLDLIYAAIERLQQMRMLTQLPFYLGLSADAQWSLGLGSKALDTLDRALALAAANDEHWWDCELYRAKGEVLRSMQGGTGDAAEEWFLAALRSSRQCEAKSLELRAAHSLARLYQSHGKRTQAYDLLAPAYGWFTEGFETKELKQARTLLAELA
jgi:hypothetical protein